MWNGGSANDGADGEWAGGVSSARGIGSRDVRARCEQVHRNLQQIVGARGALEAQETAALRDAEALRIWRYYGCTSLVDYLEREMGYTTRAAIERVRVIHALAELPTIERAMKEGRLGYSAARELTRVATAQTEAAWLDAAAGKTAREVEQLTRGRKHGDPERVNAFETGGVRNLCRDRDVRGWRAKEGWALEKG